MLAGANRGHQHEHMKRIRHTGNPCHFAPPTHLGVRDLGPEIIRVVCPRPPLGVQGAIGTKPWRACGLGIAMREWNADADADEQLCRPLALRWLVEGSWDLDLDGMGWDGWTGPSFYSGISARAR